MHAELTELARNRACSDVVLVTGDGDLLPGLMSAKEHGVAVHLWAVQAADGDYNQSEDLVAEADERRVLDRAWITRAVRAKDLTGPCARLRRPAPRSPRSSPRPCPRRPSPLRPSAPQATAPRPTPRGTARAPAPRPRFRGHLPYRCRRRADRRRGLRRRLRALRGLQGRPHPEGPRRAAPSRAPRGPARPRRARQRHPALVVRPRLDRPARQPRRRAPETASLPTLAQLTSAEQRWADREEDITTVGGDPFEVGQVFARRWMDRLPDPSHVDNLSSMYPRIPHRIDGELLRYAARFAPRPQGRPDRRARPLRDPGRLLARDRRPRRRREPRRAPAGSRRAHRARRVTAPGGIPTPPRARPGRPDP